MYVFYGVSRDRKRCFFKHDRLHVGLSKPLGTRETRNARSYNENVSVQDCPRYINASVA